MNRFLIQSKKAYQFMQRFLNETAEQGLMKNAIQDSIVLTNTGDIGLVKRTWQNCQREYNKGQIK